MTTKLAKGELPAVTPKNAVFTLICISWIFTDWKATTHILTINAELHGTQLVPDKSFD